MALTPDLQEADCILYLITSTFCSSFGNISAVYGANHHKLYNDIIFLKAVDHNFTATIKKYTKFSRVSMWPCVNP